MSRVIAIDGPSGAGKSSVSKLVGRKLGFLHVDSGALYRIMTWQALVRGVDTSDPAAVAAFAPTVDIECRPEDGAIAYYVAGEAPGNRIRTPEINAHASQVATVREVRDRITAILRGMTACGDLVIEGRDITTAVFPDSPARFYLTASPEARARRRQKEEVEKGIANQSAEAVKASLLARDAIDSTRKYAPLKKADGALEIDSSDLTLAQVVETVVNALPRAWRPADVISFGEVLWDVIEGVPHIGGAPFNFAAHCAMLGLDTALVSAIGAEDLGAKTRACVRDLAVDDRYVFVVGDLPTGTVPVTLKNGLPSYEIKRPVAWDAIAFPAGMALPPMPRAFYYGSLAARGEVSLATLKRLLCAYDGALTVFDVNLRQDYWSRDLVRELLAFARVLKVNDEELAALGFEPAALFAAFPKLETVVVTCGPEGCRVFSRAGEAFVSPARPDGPVVDTVGAGDAFAAAFLAALLAGRSLSEAAEAGNVRGGRVAARAGAIPADLKGV